MQSLPIDAHRKAFERAMAASPRIVLQGPTGSGKSTRVPPWVAARVSGKVLVLQPRRLAARLLARRVAQEQGTPLGEGVGYQVRFENRTRSSTQLVYCTEGILLRMLVDDPELADVSAVVFDEFHERHVFTDVSLARLLKLQQSMRPELLLVVMSATLDLPGLTARLAPCETLAAEGRSFPVDVEYLPASALTRKGRPVPVWDLAASALRQALEHGVEGDVLVFMPGGYEIRRTIEAIRGQCRGHGLDVRALYGDLSAADQDRALSGGSSRRVIVSTNIAETSITIDGVRLVIDSGLARQSGFDPGHGINRLDVVAISQASAEQRRGRAGRTAPGVCLRLWSEAQHRRRAEYDVPEIHRVELSEVALGLKASGEADLREFPWFDPPGEAAIDQSEQLLQELGAVDEKGALTAMGQRLLRFPVHPRFARMMVEAGGRDCLREVALVAAILQGRPLVSPRTRGGAGEQAARAEELVLAHADPSDVEVLLRAHSFAHRNRYDAQTCQRLGIHGGAAREAGQLQKHFLSVAERLGLAVNEVPGASEDVVRCLLVGLSDRVALRLDAGTLRCRLVGGRVAELNKQSLAAEDSLLIAVEVTGIGRQDGSGKVVIQTAAAVHPEWLEEAFPDDFSEGTVTTWDDGLRRVVSQKGRRFRDLVMEQKESGTPDPEQVAVVMADRVQQGHLTVKSWDAGVRAWIARVNVVAAALPEWGVPFITKEDERAILEQALYGLSSAKQVKNAEVSGVLRDWLSAEQQAAVAHSAPLRYKLPKGREVKIRYEEDGHPVLAATVQQLYDLERPVTICDGRVRLRIEILGPNRRPVHITDDLSTFWGESYERVKKDLKGRYPKHEWR